jgi:single-strand DNA-binding protein
MAKYMARNLLKGKAGGSFCMSDLNRVFLLGRIGNDLELKTTQQGKKWLRISLATNSHRAGEEPVTYWHKVVVFGLQAETCALYLKKGSQVMVEGHLEVRTWHDKEKEEKRTSVSVVANWVQFIGGRKLGEEKAEEGEAELMSASA